MGRLVPRRIGSFESFKSFRSFPLYINRSTVKMRLLNLFSGTDSVAKPWKENGHDCISVDIDPRFNPEICDDILQIDYATLPIPDVIWASPPCDQYSRARTRAKTSRNLVLA